VLVFQSSRRPCLWLRCRADGLPHYVKVEEIAGFVAYLSGLEAGYITDTNLSIEGGFLPERCCRLEQKTERSSAFFLRAC
jgi:hypothetical protein